MKKFIATALTMLTVFSCSAVAFAADETVLTTTVPDATYTLNIPADQEIPFGATSTDIGNVTVTNSSGFAAGKNLQVTLVYDAMSSNDTSTTIPYYINAYGGSYLVGDTEYTLEDKKESGSYLTFRGLEDGSCKEYYHIDDLREAKDSDKQLQVKISSLDWGKALAGDYSSTITFTAEVVSN